MSKKPDLKTAMQQLLAEVSATLPLHEPATFVCGITNTDCQGCPKKLLEMVDAEVSFWQHALKHGRTPKFDEIRRLGKLCLSVKRSLIRNNVIPEA